MFGNYCRLGVHKIKKVQIITPPLAEATQNLEIDRWIAPLYHSFL